MGQKNPVSDPRDFEFRRKEAQPTGHASFVHKTMEEPLSFRKQWEIQSAQILIIFITVWVNVSS